MTDFEETMIWLNGWQVILQALTLGALIGIAGIYAYVKGTKP